MTQPATHVYYIPYTGIRPAQEAFSGEIDGQSVESPAVPAHRVFSALTIAMDDPINTPETLVSIAQMIQEQDGVADATPTGFFLLDGAVAQPAVSDFRDDVHALMVKAYMAGMGDAKSEFAGAASAAAWASRELASLAAPAPDQEELELEEPKLNEQERAAALEEPAVS